MARYDASYARMRFQMVAIWYLEWTTNKEKFEFSNIL